MTSGEARSVERRASPAVVSTMNVLKTEPTLEGSAYGLGPTARTMPTTVMQDEVGPVPPAGEDGGHEAEGGHGEAGRR